MSNSKKVIKERYAKALKNATNEEACCATETQEAESCCSTTPPKLKLKEEISIPSFGSTTKLADKAQLQEGDIVVDFGSGPGHDLMRAAELVGSKGQAIGIDFTPEMIDYATKLAEELKLDNVIVHQSEIENTPLADNLADVVISNCVINLTTDKQKAFEEAFRILKPGGRLVDSDVIASCDLPESLKKDKQAWCGCVAGALTEEGYVQAIRNAGFVDINVDIESDSGKINWQGQEITMYTGIITAKKPLN